MIPSNDSIHIKNLKTFTGYIQLKNFPTTHTELPDKTDEDGDVTQEFYIEFGWKMFQYDPDI